MSLLSTLAFHCKSCSEAMKQATHAIASCCVLGIVQD